MIRDIVRDTPSEGPDQSERNIRDTVRATIRERHADNLNQSKKRSQSDSQRKTAIATIRETKIKRVHREQAHSA
jgi:hypothetical protein